jgi:hypothetical protein
MYDPDKRIFDVLTIWITWRVSYTRQELHTIRVLF